MNYKDVYRRTISSKETPFPFGKYKGLPIGEIMEIDPMYLDWAIQNTDLDLDHILLDELEAEVYGRRRD